MRPYRLRPLDRTPSETRPGTWRMDDDRRDASNRDGAGRGVVGGHAGGRRLRDLVSVPPSRRTRSGRRVIRGPALQPPVVRAAERRHRRHVAGRHLDRHGRGPERRLVRRLPGPGAARGDRRQHRGGPDLQGDRVVDSLRVAGQRGDHRGRSHRPPERRQQPRPASSATRASRRTSSRRRRSSSRRRWISARCPPTASRSR